MATSSRSTGGKSPLCGILPPVVTPLLARDTLDIPGLERLVEHVIRGGVHGLFVLGTTGEGPSLSHRLRREMVGRACHFAAGRVPVLVCVMDTSFEESITLACHAADCGADAVVASTPCYFPLSQLEVRSYFESLSLALPLPLYLYNFPGMTKTGIALATVRQLMQNDCILGIKDSSGDLDYFRQLIPMMPGRPGWSVFMGPESLTAEVVRLGASGGVNGSANLLPQLFVDNYEAAASGDDARSKFMEDRVRTFVESFYPAGSSYIRCLKCALSLMGICGDEMDLPFSRFDDSERSALRERMTAMGLLPNNTRFL